VYAFIAKLFTNHTNPSCIAKLLLFYEFFKHSFTEHKHVGGIL